MRFGFSRNFSNNKDMNFAPVGQGFGFEGKAKMLGINVDSFYEIDANGEKVINTAKLMQAIAAAESATSTKDAENASQSDSFVKTNSEDKNIKEEKEVKTEKETIEEEYETAYKNFYAEMNMANSENQQSKETADAWAEMKDMQFNLTKKGVTNATVIAGASEFISKLEETIAMTKAELKETEQYSAYDFTIDAQSDEDADLFKNNPFWASAFETSKKEKEIAVA